MKQEIQWARQLVDLFYPLVELTVFDAAGQLQEILNALSSLKEDQIFDFKDAEITSPFQQLLNAGRSVRCLIHPIVDGDNVIGYLRLRYDLTHFFQLQEQLSFLVQSPQGLNTQRTIDPWKAAIDQIISNYVIENKISLEASSTKQKRELIALLQAKGLFDFKESSAYIASKLQLSRATVYNYLKTAADFKQVHVHQVDAFTNQRFGGNPAGVVLDADGLDDTNMRKIARELNLSETAFVLPSTIGSFKMRYFTPTGHEVTFCGHSTVGALYMIAKEKRFGIDTAGKHSFDVETLGGRLKMDVWMDAQGEIRVAYEAPVIDLQPIDISHESVAHAVGFDLQLINRSFPIMYEKTNKDLFVVIQSLQDLKRIESNSKSLTAFSKHHDIVALCLVTPEAFDTHNQFHMRCYAPRVGISEDPFTGSVLGGLTAYVHTFGLLPEQASSFHVEQGHFIDRPGVVEVEFSKKRGRYVAKVLAQAVHCFSTEIKLT